MVNGVFLVISHVVAEYITIKTRYFGLNSYAEHRGALPHDVNKKGDYLVA